MNRSEKRSCLLFLLTLSLSLLSLLLFSTLFFFLSKTELKITRSLSTPSTASALTTTRRCRSCLSEG